MISYKLFDQPASQPAGQPASSQSVHARVTLNWTWKGKERKKELNARMKLLESLFAFSFPHKGNTNLPHTPISPPYLFKTFLIRPYFQMP
jgi:hypothetical protein